MTLAVKAFKFTRISIINVIGFLHHQLWWKIVDYWVPFWSYMQDRSQSVWIPNCYGSKNSVGFVALQLQEFSRRLITVAKIWIYDNTPQTKQQAKQYLSTKESTTKIPKLDIAGNRVKATVFWNASDRIEIGYPQRNFIINGEDCPRLLDPFDHDLKKKRPSLASKNVFFYQDNLNVHTWVVAVGNYNELGYELLARKFYSLGSAVSDCFSFPIL